MTPWLMDRLRCPRDRQHLTLLGGSLICSQGHNYPVVNGIPVMLLEEVEQTQWNGRKTLEQAADPGFASVGRNLESMQSLPGVE
jgi:uncharacterized protein YbaR (Trm112 family)